MSIISRGFAGLSGDAAHSMFAFAENPWVGLSVGVLGTVLIQSSTTTTAIAVTAVGAGGLPIRAAIPIIIGANLGTTVTPTLVALTFVGSRTEFRRALGASTIHDFYNWLALLIFFPIELIWHPLERISGTLTNALYGTGWLPDPAHFNFVRAATRPVENGVITATTHISETLGPLFTVVIGARTSSQAPCSPSAAPSSRPRCPKAMRRNSPDRAEKAARYTGSLVRCESAGCLPIRVRAGCFRPAVRSRRSSPVPTPATPRAGPCQRGRVPSESAGTGFGFSGVSAAAIVAYLRTPTFRGHCLWGSSQ